MVAFAELLAKKIPPEFPSVVNINSEVKEIILKMLKYEESERIEWQDLFNFPRFK